VKPDIHACLLAFLSLFFFDLGDGQAQPLKVGISMRSMPCTFQSDGQWRGSFFETWSELAVSANLPFEVVAIPNFKQLLEAGQRGQIDVALGCINMTPDRLAAYRFSVPIQEDGISVLTRKENPRPWLQVLRTLWSLELLGLLGGILTFVFCVTLALWRIEGYGRQDSTRATGAPRTFSKLFQILLTGPGTNVIATTVRGNSLIGFVYFIRIVAASVLVSYVSVSIIKRSSEEFENPVRSLADLGGKVVAAGTGSVSEHWVQAHNSGIPETTKDRRITVQQIDNLEQACDALMKGRVDAVIADNAQIQYYITKLNPRAPVHIAIRNVHRQSQGLIFSPQLPAETALKINQAIARLKENGTIDNVKKRWLPGD
jgi:ABC-type amino acid transport substrate-binding protein